MKKFVIFGLIFFIGLGCNFSAVNPPISEGKVATEVSQQLTASPLAVSASTETPDTTALSSTLTPETISSTPTLTLTPTTTLTPTLSPDDPRTKLGAPDWKEDFNKSNQNFFQDENDNIRFFYDNNSLALTAKQPIDWMGWSLSYPKPKNFYLEATFNVETCAGLDRYGIVYRAPDFSNGYAFGFSCDGQYSFRKINQPGTLIAWKPDAAINSGSNQVNRIGILAQGDRYAFYANGKLLEQTIDSTYVDAGLFGAFISSINTPNFTVRMDEIAFWNK